MRRFGGWGLLGVGVAGGLLVGGAAGAHAVGLSQGVYRATAEGVEVTLTFARGEVRGFAAELEQDGDGALSEVELLQGERALEAGIVGGLSIVRGEAACAGALVRARLVEEDGLELVARYRCPAAGEALTIDFVGLRRLGRPHRHVARVIPPGREAVTHERVLSRMRPPVTVPLRAAAEAAEPAATATGIGQGAEARAREGGAPAPREAGGGAREARGEALAYFTLGVEHILEGIDHLVFLLGLLLAGGGLRGLVAVVTAFTLGHSLSLALALLGGWAPSPAWVEPAIAASIIAVGVENLSAGTCPKRQARTRRRRPWITGPFGLVHGFGFAGALAAVGLPASERGRALLGFNLGVEAGQLLAIALALPLLAGVDRLTGGRRWRRWVDLAVIAAGALWLAQRLLAGA